jgi:hypothetical protein
MLLCFGGGQSGREGGMQFAELFPAHSVRRRFLWGRDVHRMKNSIAPISRRCSSIDETSAIPTSFTMTSTARCGWQADDLAELLAELRPTRCVGIGSSSGGRLLGLLAIRDPVICHARCSVGVLLVASFWRGSVAWAVQHVMTALAFVNLTGGVEAARCLGMVHYLQRV